MMADSKKFVSVCVYMFNKFDLDESINLFGGDKNNPYCIGAYMFNKWVDSNFDCGRYMLGLDEDNLDKIVERALSLYDGRENKN